MNINSYMTDVLLNKVNKAGEGRLMIVTHGYIVNGRNIKVNFVMFLGFKKPICTSNLYYTMA